MIQDLFNNHLLSCYVVTAFLSNPELGLCVHAASPLLLRNEPMLSKHQGIRYEAAN